MKTKIAVALGLQKLPQRSPHKLPAATAKSSPKTAQFQLQLTATRKDWLQKAPEPERNENCPSSFEISERLARFDEKDGIQFPSQRPILLAATGSVRETSLHLQEKSCPFCRINLRHIASVIYWLLQNIKGRSSKWHHGDARERKL